MIRGPARRMKTPEVSIMPLRNSPDRYGAVSLTLHWLAAVLIVAAWLLGTFDDVLPKGPARDAGLFAHITFGLAMLVLLAIRVPWRLADLPPGPLADPFDESVAPLDWETALAYTVAESPEVREAAAKAR